MTGPGLQEPSCARSCSPGGPAAILLSVVAAALTGCFSKPRSGLTAEAPACGAAGQEAWCSESWSKTYSAVLSHGGFDELVSRCPGDEARFYDRGATRLPGKYEWYCASRARYFARAKRQGQLSIVGFYLPSDPSSAVTQRVWVPGAFSRLVHFDDRFYPLEDGECYVDFADHKVGGGVFRSGLAQEEKLFLSLPELLVVVRERTRAGRPLYLSSDNDGRFRNSDVLVFRDVMRPAPALPKSLDLQCGRPPSSAFPCARYVAGSGPSVAGFVTLIAVNAQEFDSDGYYNAGEFRFLANKVLAAFGAARQVGCHHLNSGPLGAGVFNGNLDLTVALHASMAVAFGLPVTLWGISGASNYLSTLTGWIEQDASLPVATVLRKLRQGVSWGHGSGKSTEVHLDRDRWDAA